jgi:hypothetical protein
MRAIVLLGFLAILAGCSKPDRAADTATVDTGMNASAAPTSPTISLADFAGKWNTRATDERGTMVGEAVLVARTDTSGWTLTFPKQKPLPMRVVAVAGDSIVTEMGPYDSYLRKGAKIVNHAVNRLKDGKLVATVEARYTFAGRDSVVHLQVEGTRAP